MNLNSEIEKRYRVLAKKNPLVVAGDCALHPYSRKSGWFDSRAPRPCVFRYPCVGVFMGPTEVLHDSMVAMLKLREEIGPSIKQKFYENDQGWWILALTYGRMTAVIDYACLISVSLHYYSHKWFYQEKSPTKMTNRVHPCIIHFNGESVKRPLYKKVLEELNLA